MRTFEVVKRPGQPARYIVVGCNHCGWITSLVLYIRCPLCRTPTRLKKLTLPQLMNVTRGWN
jgi:hypothetical protein